MASNHLAITNEHWWNSDNIHLESEYTSAGISDTNNPYATIEASLVGRFGMTQGADNVVVFIAPAERSPTEQLLAFFPLMDRLIRGRLAACDGPPKHPGRVIGRTNGCWVVEWGGVPENFMIGFHLGAKLATETKIELDDENALFSSRYWANRYAIMKLKDAELRACMDYITLAG
jgi:hypothetical protein